MPPREELLDHKSFDGNDALAKASLSKKQITDFDASSATKPKSVMKLRERRRRPRIVFRNTHGIVGVASTLLVCIAIGAQQWNKFSRISSVLAAIASIVTASSGITIVDQAPKQTVVMEYPFRVVPPHRDAFQRTAYSIYYLSARTCWNTISNRITTNSGDYMSWIWGIAILCYAVIHFMPDPRKCDLANGNTWVFVIPMAAGLSVDAFFQLPFFQCNNGICWNDDVITQIDLLWVLLSGLVVAFVFTLAFRGVLGIRRCYWGAALIVHAIVAYLIAKAFPFITNQII